MKSINNYIIEKLKIRKGEITSFDKILNIVDEYNLERIENYKNDLLAPGLYFADDALVYDIKFDDEKITIFYVNVNNDEEDGDITFSHDEWYDYFDEAVTKSIYNHLVKNIKK